MSSTTNTNYRVGKTPYRTQTCDTCKLRHQKCSGTQPQCNNCELRGLSCSYSRRAGIPETAISPHEQISAPLTDSQPTTSSSDYARLYSQIFGDIVRDLNLSRNPNPGVHGQASVSSRLCQANLPSFFGEVSAIVDELDSGGTDSSSSATSPLTSQMRGLALDRNFEHIRKLLTDSLPPRVESQRLLDLFFDYQNSIFYVCKRTEAQSELNLMYDDPSQSSISWFCQMFLIFSVAIQFDDLEDNDKAAYHEIGKKHMDDAIEESPQNTLWVMRAMLLLCFYQPPTKWNSIWIYLDTAIRGAHRFQLDLGYNQLKEITDEEYQEWRQLWLTIISFDRWVAIFLGRLPHVKESISRDPIFKGSPLRQGLDHCAMQNDITSIAIISGNILRDMYFLKEFRVSICRQYKTDLETWTAKLPNPLRQQVVSGVIQNMPKDQAEATLNLHFMLLGAWMLLTRPFLLKVVKSKMSPTSFAGPVVSAIISDAMACIDQACRLINSAATTLFEPLPPKRSFMLLFFLINAANVVVLGAIWKGEQSRQRDYFPLAYDQGRELAAVDAAIRVLDFCGQRNTFARRYSILVKELRQRLGKAAATHVNSPASPSSAASLAIAQGSAPSSRSVARLTELSTYSDFIGESGVINNLGAIVEQNRMLTPPLANVDLGRGLYSPRGSLNIGPDFWSEQDGTFYPIDDISSYDSTSFMQGSDEQNFMDDVMQ